MTRSKTKAARLWPLRVTHRAHAIDHVLRRNTPARLQFLKDNKNGWAADAKNAQLPMATRKSAWSKSRIWAGKATRAKAALERARKARRNALIDLVSVARGV